MGKKDPRLKPIARIGGKCVWEKIHILTKIKFSPGALLAALKEEKARREGRKGGGWGDQDFSIYAIHSSIPRNVKQSSKVGRSATFDVPEHKEIKRKRQTKGGRSIVGSNLR